LSFAFGIKVIFVSPCTRLLKDDLEAVHIIYPAVCDNQRPASRTRQGDVLACDHVVEGFDYLRRDPIVLARSLEMADPAASQAADRDGAGRVARRDKRDYRSVPGSSAPDTDVRKNNMPINDAL
jgi:hypothetical protein